MFSDSGQKKEFPSVLIISSANLKISSCRTEVRTLCPEGHHLAIFNLTDSRIESGKISPTFPTFHLSGVAFQCWINHFLLSCCILIVSGQKVSPLALPITCWY